MMNAVPAMGDSPAAATWITSSRQSALSALLRGMASGDQAAMAALYDETGGMLFALAIRITGNSEDAEEVLHDVYCRAWRKADSYEESRGSVMAWLVLMTRSVAIDLVRARKHDVAAVPIESLTESCQSHEFSPETQASTSQTAANVRAALRTLSDEQRQVIELAFFSGLTHSEMAERLALPLGTVKTRIRAGLTKLRANLEGTAL